MSDKASEKRLRIVVDTDVVRAAAKGHNRPQKAKQAANVLFAIYEGNFALALSEELRNEWLRERSKATGTWKFYLSPFAFEWLTEMNNRQRVVPVTIDYRIGDIILKALPQYQTAKRQKLRADFPVILTALAADHRLVSNNRTERKTLRQACTDAQARKILANLLWPISLKAACSWLQTGAENVSTHRVCNGS